MKRHILATAVCALAVAAVAAVSTSQAQTKKAPAASASFAGSYRGQFDGGNGHVTIKGKGPTYQAEITVVGEGGCVAEAKGNATARGNNLVMTLQSPDGRCTITMARSGASLRMSEQNCSSLHGMSCGFDGTVRKVK